MSQRNRPRWLAFLLFGLMLVAVVAGGYYVLPANSATRKDSAGIAPAAKDRPPVPVRVAKAEKRTLTPSVKVIGTVQADPQRVATLTAPVPGLVTKLVVSEGSRVREGDLIVQLDEQQARIDLEQAQAAYDRLVARSWEEEVNLALSAVEKARAAYLLAEARWKAATELHAQSPNLVPELQLKEQQSAAQVARAELDAAEAQLKLMRREVRQAQEREALAACKAAELRLKWCRVTTPLGCEVVELKARVGQRVDVGTPLATILDTSEVIVQARVPGNRLAGVAAAIQAGGKAPVAAVSCASFPGKVFPALSGWLSPQTEGQTGDVPVKLRVANPQGLLRVGMTVWVELQEAPVEALAIPEVAVTVNEDGQRVVTLIRDGKAMPREIQIASDTEPEVRVAGWVRVLKGLEAGDEVAVENGYALPAGTPVAVLPPAAKLTP